MNETAPAVLLPAKTDALHAGMGTDLHPAADLLRVAEAAHLPANSLLRRRTNADQFPHCVRIGPPASKGKTRTRPGDAGRT